MSNIQAINVLAAALGTKIVRLADANATFICEPRNEITSKVVLAELGHSDGFQGAHWFEQETQTAYDLMVHVTIPADGEPNTDLELLLDHMVARDLVRSIERSLENYTNQDTLFSSIEERLDK